MLRILTLVLVLVTLVYSAPNAVPPVPAPSAAPITNQLGGNGRCATLCRAGLGGIPCGCPPEVVQSVFHRKVHTWRVEHPEERIIYGPRRDLCPSLCEKNLGKPLCRCSNSSNNNTTNISPEDWCPICHDILYAEYSPQLWIELGCHEKDLLHNCLNKNLVSRKRKRDIQGIIAYASKGSGSDVDWDLWCEVQCYSNNGGLACNCDMLPLSTH